VLIIGVSKIVPWFSFLEGVYYRQEFLRVGWQVSKNIMKIYIYFLVKGKKLGGMRVVVTISSFEN